MTRPAATPPAGTADLREALAQQFADILFCIEGEDHSHIERGQTLADAALANFSTERATLRERAEKAERERDEARLDRSVLTRALTGLTCGGSEFFIRRGDEPVADAAACVAYVRRVRGDHQASRVAALREKAAAESRLATLAAENEALRADIEGWKRLAVLAAVALEPIRMSGAYKCHIPETVAAIDVAVVAIRMAVTDGMLPPAGSYDDAAAPARAALAPGGSDAA